MAAKSVLVQEAFAVLGIAVGVALLFASQVASTSLSHSVEKLTHQLVGNTQLQITNGYLRRFATYLVSWRPSR
jgi:hypothetical protein